MNLQEQISELVNEKISGTELFLVEVKIGPGKVAVTLDHPTGVRIEDCVAVNRFIQDRLENTDTFESRELEVGSPGLEEPLKVIKQFEKRVGCQVGVVTFDGMKHLGTLKSVNENGIELDEIISVKSGNKKEKQQQINQFPFTQIKETRVQFNFDKII